MGWMYPPMYGKKINYYEKKIAKIDRKIKSLEEDKKIYEEILSKKADDTTLA